jgi:hypothetical protein
MTTGLRRNLHLCAQGHEALWTQEEPCPFCAALMEVRRLARELVQKCRECPYTKAVAKAQARGGQDARPTDPVMDT